mgnify:CR=1 FL=1
MTILLTGATGYIGKRLLPALLELGHHIICCVRDKKRFPTDGVFANSNIQLLEIDFTKPVELIPEVRDVDAAYYLIHSMSDSHGDFQELEAVSANNFNELIKQTRARQIIYLGGIANEAVLSRHLASRKKVEAILAASEVPLTAIRAGIIVGSGSSSFEIIRDLVEKLPIMIAPKWLNTRIQPIAVRNILEYLVGVLDHPQTLNRSFDVGGREVLTYKQMLLQFAEVRKLRRWIYTMPIMSPRISSYWLYFVTSTSYHLAVNLVNSMKIEVVAADNELEQLLGIKPMSYREAVQLAFQRIAQNEVPSSWKDALVSSSDEASLADRVNMPVHGCLLDSREVRISGDSAQVLDNIWAVGGRRGWYYGNWLWQIRGFMDKLAGGVGLRRGRRSPIQLNSGDAVDFWRVLVADRPGQRLLLYAEMKLPGEAWLEFRIKTKEDGEYLQQIATFRPIGVLGRLYWHTVSPLHFFVFGGMIRNMERYGR